MGRRWGVRIAGLLMGLLLLLLLAPPALAAGAEYQVFYQEVTTRFVAQGVAAEGETRGYRFVIDEANVTRVEFLLTWEETGDQTGLSGDDTFTLTGADPDGRPLGAPAAASGGEARLASRSVNAMPEDGPVAAGSMQEHVDATTSREGIGEWRAWVKLEDVGNPQGADVDTGNSFTLTAIVHHYEGTPMRVVSLGPAARAAADDISAGWALALGGLLALACALGAGIWLQSRGRRRARLSPAGDKTAPSGR